MKFAHVVFLHETAKQIVSYIGKSKDEKLCILLRTVISFTLHKYIGVIRTFSLSGEVSALSSREKLGWSAVAIISKSSSI